MSTIVPDEPVLMTREEWCALESGTTELPTLRRTFPFIADDQVMSVHEWCELNSFSYDTGRRIIKRREITVIWLSNRRQGVTGAADREWKARRALPAIAEGVK